MSDRKQSLYSGALHSEVNPFRINPRYGKHRCAEIKKPWKQSSMHSYGLKTHRCAKFFHSAAIFALSVSEGRARKQCGRPFWASGGHFGTADQLFLKNRYAKIGKRNAYQSSQSDFSLSKHRNAITFAIAIAMSLCRFIVKQCAR